MALCLRCNWSILVNLIQAASCEPRQMQLLSISGLICSWRWKWTHWLMSSASGAQLPPAEHLAWSQRARNFIIDGSPRWEVYRTCDVSLLPDSRSFDSSAAQRPVLSKDSIQVQDGASSASATAEAIIEAWRDQDGTFAPGRERSHEVSLRSHLERSKRHLGIALLDISQPLSCRLPF